MPRKKKTQSGAPAQNIPRSIPGVRYGEGVQQQQMAQAMPMQDATAVSRAQPTAMPSVPKTPPNLSQLPALMANMPIGALTQPSNPDNFITSGLSTGPGAGPNLNAAGNTTPLARMLKNLYLSTGDENFNRLAQRLGAQ